MILAGKVRQTCESENDPRDDDALDDVGLEDDALDDGGLEDEALNDGGLDDAADDVDVCLDADVGVDGIEIGQICGSIHKTKQSGSCHRSESSFKDFQNRSFWKNHSIKIITTRRC